MDINLVKLVNDYTEQFGQVDPESIPNYEVFELDKFENNLCIIEKERSEIENYNFDPPEDFIIRLKELSNISDIDDVIISELKYKKNVLPIYILDKDAYQELLNKTNNKFKHENPLTDEILFPLTVNHFPLSISDIKNNNTFIKSRQRTVFGNFINIYTCIS